jgi:phosphate transport system substrate-binding protein
MKTLDLKKSMGYAVGAAFAGLGVAILAGWLALKTNNPGLRAMFGIFLVLYGVYKISRASVKTLPSNRQKGRLLAAMLAISFGFGGCGGKKKPPEETIISGKINIIVSEPYKSLFEIEAAEFNRYYPKACIHVLSASTREAVVNLLNDSVKVVAVDRGLNAEERGVAEKAAMKLEEYPVAEDALAVLVSPVNDLESVSMETLRRILTGSVNRWNQLPKSGLSGPLALVLTGRNSGAYELLKNAFFNLDKDISLAVLAADQDSLLEHVARRANAVGLVSLACLKDTASASAAVRFSGKVKTLAITGVDSATNQITAFPPHQANVYLKKYPLHYTMTMIRNLDHSPLAAGFITFVCSTPGQKIFLNRGLVPKHVQIRLVQLSEEEITQ